MPKHSNKEKKKNLKKKTEKLDKKKTLKKEWILSEEDKQKVLTYLEKNPLPETDNHYTEEYCRKASEELFDEKNPFLVGRIIGCLVREYETPKTITKSTPNEELRFTLLPPPSNPLNKKVEEVDLDYYLNFEKINEEKKFSLN